MRCKNVLKRLSSFQDGECGFNQSAEIKQHLEICPTCRSEWMLINRLAREMKRLKSIEADRHFTRSIMARISDRKRAFPRPIASIVYSFVFLLFFFLGIFLSQKIDSPRLTETSTPTMIQLLTESQQFNRLDIKEKAMELLYTKENNENQ